MNAASKSTSYLRILSKLSAAETEQSEREEMSIVILCYILCCRVFFLRLQFIIIRIDKRHSSDRLRP